MRMNDPFNLQRFVDAQHPAYQTARAELRAGRKRSHWMWFIFPQAAGLGHSQMARRFAIASRAEAVAYLQHPVLGSRLRECSEIVARLDGLTAHAIFGSPDDLKFRSSMTLFSQVAPGDRVFAECLQKYFNGEPDPATRVD
jgi:uncharacterized protein (DUF1810 family)